MAFRIIHVDGVPVKVIGLTDGDGLTKEFFTAGEILGGVPHFSADRGAFPSLEEAMLAHREGRPET